VRWRRCREGEGEGARERPDPSVGHLGTFMTTQDYVSCCRVPLNGRGSVVRFKV
jgi:hypothetical protein